MESHVDSLCSASARGDLKKVLLLLQSGADINGQNKFNRTPLQVVMLGHTPLVQTLLAAGANPNARDQASELTVIHDAAREGFVETVRALMAYGADANLADAKGNLPLHLAAREGHVEVVRLLLRRTSRALSARPQSARQLERDEATDYIKEYWDSQHREAV